MPEFVRNVPDGDNQGAAGLPRLRARGYENPKVVVGSVVVHRGRVLLCRRAIMPRRGFWTLPAGYLELGETAEEGARREAMEEAGAEIALDGVLGLFSISRIGQVQVIFRARFARPWAAAAHRRRAGEPGGGPVRLGRDSVAGDRVPLGSLGAPCLAPCGRGAAWRARREPARGRTRRSPAGIRRRSAMTRRDAMMGAALLPLMVMLGAAGPISAGGSFSAATAPSAGTPPADPGFEPAPMPDLSLAAPSSKSDGNSNAPSVRPDLFTQSQQWQGNGFVNNSTAEAQRDSRMRPGAGFSISVPMQ